MKVRKILFGMTAGMMAVSSAIVYQVSAGAVDPTLYSDTAVKSWNSIEVDLSKAGIAGDDSSLEISCTAPEDAVDGHRLFNVIINGTGIIPSTQCPTTAARWISALPFQARR